MDFKRYDINGVVCTQTFLTIEKTELLLELFSSFKTDLLTSPSEIGKFLFKEKKFEQFMKIVLECPAEVDFSKMRVSQGVEIISDFLSSEDFSTIISGIFTTINHLGWKMEAATKAGTKAK